MRSLSVLVLIGGWIWPLDDVGVLSPIMTLVLFFGKRRAFLTRFFFGSAGQL